ncbi:hypothetical protein K2173_002590 [Erythroxylum novogranatense]|uniref:Epidermal patterning factor-like protein n=1 Tax=Erythroxylum novogranatense TaxID=1862640 RepID=A0AAV8TR23_9ROSI|nr:hypothetical protein K2173_002590 [Erythroxylum novogranatense]
MGYSGYKFLLSQKLGCFAISFVFLWISSSTQVRFMAEGKASPALVTPSQTVNEEDKRMILRSQIGSRPPRCEGRCTSCGHCEAIQVPTNPQVSTIAYARGDDSSNYKPMSWKCKCGNLILNP